MKIQTCSPEIGFILSGNEEIHLYYKWVFWKKGITGKEFRSEWKRDIKDIMAIEDAVNQRELREAQLRKLMANVKW